MPFTSILKISFRSGFSNMSKFASFLAPNWFSSFYDIVFFSTFFSVKFCQPNCGDAYCHTQIFFSTSRLPQISVWIWTCGKAPWKDPVVSTDETWRKSVHIFAKRLQAKFWWILHDENLRKRIHQLLKISIPSSFWFTTTRRFFFQPVGYPRFLYEFERVQKHHGKTRL